jgi:hypothetical protein
MATNSKGTKNDTIIRLQTIAGAALQNFANKTLVINGEAIKTADFAAMLQAQVKAMQNANELRTAWLNATAKNNETYNTQIAPAITGIKHYAAAMLGTNSTEYASFGFAIKKAVRTLPDKVAAVAQSLATRAARHTMGDKQRQRIKGVVSPASAATAAAVTASTTSTASASNVSATPSASTSSPGNGTH